MAGTPPPKATPPAGGFNLFQAILLFTDQASRGGKVPVTREDYLRNVRRSLGGVPYSDLQRGLQQLQGQGVLDIEYLGPGDFQVRLTAQGEALLHPGTPRPAEPPPTPDLPSQTEPPLPGTGVEAPQEPSQPPGEGSGSVPSGPASPSPPTDPLSRFVGEAPVPSEESASSPAPEDGGTPPRAPDPSAEQHRATSDALLEAISARQLALEERERALAVQEDRLRSSEEEIARRQTALGGREAELAGREGERAEAERKLTELAQRLEERTRSVEGREQELSTRESQVQAKEAVLSAAPPPAVTTDLSAQGEALRQQEAELSRLREDLEKRELAARERLKMLGSREDKLRADEATLRDREAHILSQEEGWAQLKHTQEEELQRHRSELEALTAQAQGQIAQVQERHTRLDAVERNQKANHLALSQKESQLSERERALVQREEEFTRREHLVKGIEERQTRRATELEALSHSLKDREASLLAREREQASRESAHHEAELALSRRKAELEDRENGLLQQAEALRVHEAQMEALEGQRAQARRGLKEAHEGLEAHVKRHRPADPPPPGEG